MSNQTVDFLGIIETRLAHLPNSEVEKVISYYNESIEDRLEDGMSEEEAIKSFGTIDNIVSDIEAEMSFYTVVEEKINNSDKTVNVNGHTVREIALDNDGVEYIFEGNYGEIHFETDNRGVVVKKSVDDKIHLVVYQNKYEYYEIIENENLTVKYVEEKSSFGKKLSFLNENMEKAELYIPHNENQKLFINSVDDDIDVTDVKLNAVELSDTNGYIKFTNSVSINTKIGNVNGDIKAANIVSGSIEINNVNGNTKVINTPNESIKVYSNNGDIEIMNNMSKDKIDISNRNGDIKVMNIESKSLVGVNNKNGDIDVKNVKGDSVKISNKNGDIKVDKVESKNAFDISNKNASIEVSDISGENIKIENRNDDIKTTGMSSKGNIEISNEDAYIEVNDISGENIKITNKNDDIKITDVCSKGNVEISNEEADIDFGGLEFLKELIVKCNDGSVMGDIKGVESDYTFNVIGDNCKSRVNGKRIDGIIGTGDKLVRVECNDGLVSLGTN